jgi:rhodanese-related sulfurtransferase
MNEKLQSNVFFNINDLKNQVKDLQSEVKDLGEKLEKSLAVERCHLLRVKNGEMLPDDYILNGRLYNDLSPEQAFQFYSKQNENFILLDVSEKSYHPSDEFPEAIKIPLEELPIRFKEIINKAVPILIISENGIRSILACEMLNQVGYYNVNNISGGYKFWPAFRQKVVPILKKVA